MFVYSFVVGALLLSLLLSVIMHLFRMSSFLCCLNASFEFDFPVPRTISAYDNIFFRDFFSHPYILFFWKNVHVSVTE